MSVTSDELVMPERPRAVEQCDEPVCPCPGAPCAISQWAATNDGQHGRALAALTQLHHAAAAVRAHLERTVLAADELSWSAWEVLAVVDVWGSIETRDVAAEVVVAKSTLSGLLTTLTGRGLLLRSVYPGDARRAVLTLTDAGHDLVARVFPSVARAEAELVGDLSDAELAALCNATRGLLRKVDRLR